MALSVTRVIWCIFIAYIAHSMWSIYSLFHPEQCQPNKVCLKPWLAQVPPPELEVSTFLGVWKGGHLQCWTQIVLNIDTNTDETDTADAFRVPITKYEDFIMW